MPEEKYDTTSHWTALDVPAFALGQEVLLVCRTTEDEAGAHRPEFCEVAAISPGWAKYLHSRGRLAGWTPV